MKCLELIQKLETLAPSGCACDWDNVGLLVGWKEQEIHRILIALDATDEVVEEAIRMRADLLLTHHPLIFKPLKKVNDDDFIALRVMSLIQYNVNYYAMHTNFDAAPGCMADIAAGRLGLLGPDVLEVMGTMEIDGKPVPYGIGKVGTLPYAMTLKELALFVIASLCDDIKGTGPVRQGAVRSAVYYRLRGTLGEGDGNACGDCSRLWKELHCVRGKGRRRSPDHRRYRAS